MLSIFLSVYFINLSINNNIRGTYTIKCMVRLVFEEKKLLYSNIENSSRRYKLKYCDISCCILEKISNPSLLFFPYFVSILPSRSIFYTGSVTE